MGSGDGEEETVNEPAPGGRELVAILYDCKGREPVWAGLGSRGEVVEEESERREGIQDQLNLE
jgi:hypothetical protein